MHELFVRAVAHPEDLERAATDRLFLQRCSHEALRLFPASPIAARVAVAPVRLRTGTEIPEGASVTLDLMGSPFAENGGVGTVTAILSNVSGQPVTVGLSFGGSAAHRDDYTRAAAQIVIPVSRQREKYTQV